MYKKSNITSETRRIEIDELLGEVPSSVLNWGATIILAIIVILFIGSAFIKYPRVVHGNILIKLPGKSAPLAIGYLSNKYKSNLQIGQHVIIHLNEKSVSVPETLEGTINGINPDYIKNTSEIGIHLKPGYRLPDIANLSGEMDIVVSNSTILKQILNSF